MTNNKQHTKHTHGGHGLTPRERSANRSFHGGSRGCRGFYALAIRRNEVSDHLASLCGEAWSGRRIARERRACDSRTLHPVTRGGQTTYKTTHKTNRMSAGGHPVVHPMVHPDGGWGFQCTVQQITPFSRRTANLAVIRSDVRAFESLPAMVWISISVPNMTMTTNSKPVKVFRLKGLSASIFANQSKSKDSKTPFYKVSLQRTFKDGDDFKSTTSLGRDDLPVADLLLKKAWVFILEAEHEDRKESSKEE
jgi:hypothetical protein